MSTEHVIKDKRIRIFDGVAAIIIILMIFVSFILLFRLQGEDEVIDYSDGWTVVYHGMRYEDVNLHDFVLPTSPEYNDVVTLTKHLEADLPEDTNMMFLTYLSKVSVSYNDIPLYHYGREDEAAGHMVGSGYHIFRLHRFMQDKDLKIEIMAAEENAFRSAPAIYLTPAELVLPVYAKNHVRTIAISIFLFVLGCCLVVASIIPIDIWKNRAKLSLIGMFSLLMGIWNMGNVKFLQLISADLSRNTEIEYLSLFLAPIPVLLLLESMRKRGNWQHLAVHITAVSFVCGDACFIALHYMGVRHFCSTIGIFHVMVLLGLFVVLLSGIRPRNAIVGYEYFMNVGMIILLVFCCLDMLRFYLRRYVFPTSERMSESILSIGTVVFILVLIFGYLMYLYDIMKKETEKKTLLQLAYRDPMTGLYNRASIFDVFQQALDVGENVTLLLFDVNGLKQTNDSMGHRKGDELICTFADLLDEVFEPIGTCARIGGDEFVALIPGENAGKVDAALQKFESLEAEVSAKMEFDMHAAYGRVNSAEVAERKLDDIYRLADGRMYKMKQRMKAQGVEDFRE